MPQIFLPLGTLDKCHACGGVGDLRLCSQCAERAYCSAECQKQDWKSHKTTCKTDRIDLATFYPVLACTSESARLHGGDVHPALRHKITNSPNPYTPAGPLPDGSSARIIHLGSSMSEAEFEADFSGWWPKGHTAAIRGKLMRRIAREGKVLPLVTSTCLSLMLAFYSTTTTSVADSRRVRLRYRSSPVSDFGIIAGSARVTPDDQLAYILPDKSVLKGQDPDDHYWIYFRTLKGEEVALDCNMFTFNMCLVVQTLAYVPEVTARMFPSLVPVWFKDRTMTRSLPTSDPLLTERRRISVLRDEGIRTAIGKIVVQENGDLGIPDETVSVIAGLMSRIAERPIAESEQGFCIGSMVDGVNIILDAAVRSDKWKRFPAQPQMGIESDPGELRD